jgi:serine O-acetyltransferase
MDLDRRLCLEGRRPGMLQYLGLALKRGGMAVFLFRLLDWTHARNFRLITKLGHLALYYLGRAEIHPGARIGPGLVLPDIGGVGLPAFCEIGRNCTFIGPALLTIGGMEGVDLKVDRIILGDDCVIGPNVRIIGAVTLGSGTQVKASSVVMTSFPKVGYLLSGIPARRRAVLPIEQIKRWSSLSAEFMNENISS